MLTKIISGGQTGSDQGGLEAGQKLGLETGGWIPKGWLTEVGSNPELKKYGLIEHTSSSYVPRTYANVKDSDGTLRIAYNFQSAGELCTLKAIKQYNKPYYDVNIHSAHEHEKVAQWIIDNNIQVLNIAGNRESKCPGLQEFTFNYLIEVFKCLTSSSEK